MSLNTDESLCLDCFPNSQFFYYRGVNSDSPNSRQPAA